MKTYSKMYSPKPITSKQIKFINSLYKQIGQEPEQDIENLTSRQASKLIDELIQIKEELEK